MAYYITKQFDMVDEICWRYYGRTQQTVEAVLIANPGLADMAPILPPNVAIFLPDIPQPLVSELVDLWGV